MISEIIEKWIKGILIDGITGNLSGLFDNVNAKVGEIASDVGSTPQAWNSGIFNMLRSLSETVVLPIAAAILALVMCHELIQMITEKNNMHDFDTSMFFRWIFKSAFAILIVSNTWNIVMGVFDATQSVVNQSSGVIIGETSIHFDRLIPGLEFQLESMTIGSLLSLWFQTLVVGLTMNILSICIFLVTYGRMIEIYVVTALGPMAKRLSRIERDIERLKEKISEYQQQLKELEAAKTEQENLQIIQLVRSMNMKPDEFAAFLRSGALNAAPTVTPYHKQEDAADET